MIQPLYFFPFNVNIQDAVRIQKDLSQYISFSFPFDSQEIHCLAGIDVSYLGKNLACAVVVAFSYPELQIIEVVHSIKKTQFPYIPGFLSFREGPVVAACLQKLKSLPQIFFFDGQGIAHPRGMGLASHVGILYNIVSIGVAKSVLVGQYEEPPSDKGEYTWIFYHDQIIGAALRRKKDVKPVFVSPGHRIDLLSSIEWTLKVSDKYRIPTPTRIAHLYADKIKRNEVSFDEYQ
ncbi:MAG: endonuclease V [Candidatus Atribacteria bacterium]|nr:endonuclease V [Candidatus Atribacteria bacterium]